MDGTFRIQMRDGEWQDICSGKDLKTVEIGHVVRITKVTTFADPNPSKGEPAVQSFEDFVALVNVGPGDVLLFFPRKQ